MAVQRTAKFWALDQGRIVVNRDSTIFCKNLVLLLEIFNFSGKLEN